MNRKLGIIILGGGVMQIPAIEIAKELGVLSICFDGNPNCLGAGLADRFYPIDLKDYEKVLKQSALLKKEGLAHGIITVGTDFSFTVAYVSSKLGFIGNSLETGINTTNKGQMRKVLARAGVNIPQFFTIENIEQLAELKTEFELKLEQGVEQGIYFQNSYVVKPVDSMGGRGTAMAKNFEQLKEFFNEAIKYSNSGQVIIEEYIEGPEFSIDAIVANGEIYLSGIADRTICYLPKFIEMGHTMPSSYDKGIIKAVIAEFEKAVKALKIVNGAAKGDIKYNGKAVIGEIASRLSGGYMSGWTYPYSFDYSAIEATMQIALGLDFVPPPKQHKRYTSEMAFVSVPGIVQDIIGLEKARAAVGVRNLFLRVEKGSEVDFPDNNVEKCGNIISCGNTKEEAENNSALAIAEILIKLKPLESKTSKFLFENIRKAHMPNAYTCSEEFYQEQVANLAIYYNLEKNKFFIKNIQLPKGNCWNRLSATKAYGILIKQGYIEEIAASDNLVEFPSDIFYTAFCRGGIQAIVWLADSLNFKKSKALEIIACWEKNFLPLHL